MLKSIVTKNVGPVELNVEFGSRLNVFTGDNGLGKSFLLDAIWFALTQKWPAESNPNLSTGFVGRPKLPSKLSKINFQLSQKNEVLPFETVFNREKQNWELAQGKIFLGSTWKSSLVIYALADGSFCVWDPVRAFRYDGVDFQKASNVAFAFNSQEIWNGLKQNEKNTINGLIADLCSWQDKNGFEFKCLLKLLEALSPPDFKLSIGEQTRLSLNDVRNIPTIKMPYGSVPVLHASAAIRRILSIAYCITWAFSEHLKACKITGQKQVSQITFLIDEVESHLHPSWQKKVMRALLSSVETLLKDVKGSAQIIATTHSPLVMVSLEDFFDPEKDKWFDFDSGKKGTIHFTEREFTKLGTSDIWLESKAFDMDSTRSVDSSKLIKRIYAELRDENINKERVRDLYGKLLQRLSPVDDELFLIRHMCQKKGVL